MISRAAAGLRRWMLELLNTAAERERQLQLRRLWLVGGLEG